MTDSAKKTIDIIAFIDDNYEEGRQIAEALIKEFLFDEKLDYNSLVEKHGKEWVEDFLLANMQYYDPNSERD